MNADLSRSPLTEHIEGLIRQKRAVGYRYETQAAILRRFDHFCARYHEGDQTLTKQTVNHWAERQPGESVGNLRIRLSAVRQLANYLHKLGHDDAYAVPVRSLPKYSGYIPYIFSREELAALFGCTDACRPWAGSPLRHLVMPVLFRLLYCSGMRLSEATHLKVADVDLSNGVLSLQHAKFGKARKVPVLAEMTDRLRLYYQSARPRLHEGGYFLVGGSPGEPLSRKTVYSNFRTFLWQARISHGGPGKGPRVHDLRHSHAVHCLRRWVEQGKDLQAYLPILSAYLGHSHFRQTAYYLRLTADLYPSITAQVEGAFGQIIPKVGGPDEDD